MTSFSSTAVPQESTVIDRIASTLQLPRSAAAQRFEDVKRFLHVARLTAQPISPPKAIDDAWHEWLLHSRAYRELCLTTYGKFLDHEPLAQREGDGACETFNTTIALTRLAFGDEVATRWMANAAGCSNCAPVGSCEPQSADCALNVSLVH
jgi:hypothetical protein